MEKTYTGAVPEKYCTLWERAHAGEDKKEGGTERNCCRLTVTLILLYCIVPGRQSIKAGNEGMMLSLGKRGVGEKVFLVLSLSLTVLLYF